MLHRSFKSAKCKTALNLAKSRIKLLKNRKEIQVQQLKRELAHLLQSGQNQTARIRVEHVVREEKTMAAYELIEIYCELIVARLPIIESQKNCPLDLKEAIASLIFAAPRCGDIPELQDVRKLFTAKYGKEFVAAAVELRPACGVSGIMVEKLSVKAPDGPTKVKILTAIAEEHNIKWEPKWFKDEAEMPSTDSPIQHTERANTIQMQPLNFEIADDPPERLAGEEARSAASSQSHVHADADSSAVPHSASSHADKRFGSSSEMDTSSQPFGTAENVLLTSRQNWNMEFKDATAAAQAAAESAERASMAARAAAELSTHGKIISDSSSEPVTSSVYAGREGSSGYPGSILQQENVESNHTNNSFNHMSSRMSDVQHDENEQGKMKEGSEPQTFKDQHTQYGVGVFGEVQDMRKSRDSLSSPSTSGAESNIFQFSCQDITNKPAENPFQGNSVEKENQPSSFQPQYSAFDDEYSIFSQQNNQSKNGRHDGSLFDFHQGTAAYDDWHAEDVHHSGSYGVRVDISFGEERKRDTFLGSDEQKHVFHSRKDVFVSTGHKSNEIDVEEMGTHTDTGAVFDESGSDDDEYINHVQESYDLPSPGKSVPKNFLSHEENPPENLYNQPSCPCHLPYGLEVSESFRESPIYAKLSEPVPIAFDSDGASSESEKELRNERIESQNSSKSLRFPLQSSVPVSSTEKIGPELNFEQLPSGRRNRPLRSPPYTTSSGDDAIDANQQTKASFDRIGSPQSPKETSTSHVHFASTSDDPDVAAVPKASNITARPYSAKIGENIHRTSPKTSAWYFDSDDSGSEDDPKQSSSSKTLLSAGVSRRTKACSQRSVALDNISEDSPSSPVETTQSRSGNTDSLKWNDDASSMPRPQTRDTKSKVEGSLFSSAGDKSVSPPEGAEIPRASSSNEKAPSRENLTKNLSHVHPKLPDFESFTAHLQSLRTNRR